MLWQRHGRVASRLRCLTLSLKIASALVNKESTPGEAQCPARRPRRRSRTAPLLLLLLLTALAASGCAAFQRGSEAEGPRPSSLNPQWDADAFADHLRFFRETLGDGPVEPARVNAYLADQMKAAWLQPAVEGRYRLQETPTGALGFVGYVAGKNPAYDQEVVIVCADLTAGTPAVSATALLEVARAYGTFAQYELEPERSVLFAFWFRPDSLRDSDPAAGLRAYLRQPTWAISETRSVLYVGLPPGRRAPVAALLREYDLPLRRIALPDGRVPLDTATVEGEPPRRALLRRALALAQRTHERLRAETISTGRLMPALGDTLRVPRAQE